MTLSMSPKIFVTGVTGYIAGDAVYAISKAHPEYELTFLVRSQEKADLVKKAYPDAHFAIGDLDDAALLKKHAADADIVLHAADASDHEGAAKAIRDGLISGHSKERPGFWLHTGGTGILTFADSQSGRLGEWSDKVYNDWSGVEELTSLPDDAFHRNVDKIVLEAGAQHGDVLKTAIVCPPTIYGTGRGPSSTRGRQVYEMTKLILQGRYIPIIGAGRARWNNVHVADLSDVYLLLVEAANSKRLDNELWNDRGYYIVENGTHVWSDLARAIGKQAVEMHLIESAEEKPLDKDTAMKQAGFEAVSWGLNSLAKAERARKLLGWSPKQQTLEAEIPAILRSESEQLK